MALNYCCKKFYKIRSLCKGFEPTISGSWSKFPTAMLPLKAGSWPYLEILEKAGEACKLNGHICYEEKSFKTFGPGLVFT
jgi:hypothetical protein